MDGFFVRQCDYPQVATLQLVNRAPETIPIMLLRFNSDRIFQDPNTPLFSQIWALSHDLIFEISSVPVLSHKFNNSLNAISKKVVSQNADLRKSEIRITPQQIIKV